MEFFDRVVYGNALSAWTLAVVLFVVVLFAGKLVVRQLIRGVGALARRTDTSLDDLLAGLLETTQGFFFFFVGFYAGTLVLSLPARVGNLIDKAVILAVFLQAAVWANAATTFFWRRYREQRLAADPAAATSLGVLAFVIRMVVWTVILLVALDNLGIDVTTLVAGLGVGGVAVALAVQNILGDLFASLSIALDKPFVVGDFIEVGEFIGTVEYVGLKTTRVRSLSGEQLILSNSDLLSSRIRNFKRMQERRILFVFGVLYETPRDTVARIPGIVREIIQSQKLARFDRAHFKTFGASALDFEVVYYVLDPNFNVYMDVQQAINLEMIRRFESERVSFAYPTRTVYVTMVPAAANATG